MVNPRALAAMAAVLGTGIQLVLVFRTPNYGFIGAGLAALGGITLLIAMLFQLDLAADCGFGVTVLGALACVAGAGDWIILGDQFLLAFAYQLAPMTLITIGWYLNSRTSADRRSAWADEFLARESQRDYRRP